MSTENYDPCYPDQPVVHRYLPVWAKLPAFAAKLAFVWADDGDTAAAGVTSYATLTYSQLDAAVERMASGLLGALRRADTVLVLASPGLRLVKLLFACQRAGLTAVPVIPPDPSRPGAAHAHLLRAVWQTRPRAAIADARFIDAVKKSNAVVAGEPDQLAAMLRSLRWLSVDELEQGGANGAAPVTSFMGCETEDAHLIQYTSGATGAPKPVVITAGAAAHNVRAARKAYELHPGSVVVSWLPQYHDCGLMFLLLTVVAGATCVLASPDAFVRRPSLWLELVTEFKATCTPVPSFTLPLVLRRGRSPDGRRRRRPLELGSLENLILINEPIYKSCVDEFVAKFRGDGLHAASISPSYGLAENCTFVSTAWRSRRCVDLPSYKKLLPSARLSRMADEEPEIEIAVVDEETGEPVEDGVEGEIWVSSPSNASGYLGHPSASREVFCARLPGKGAGSSCYVRTGDRGVVRGAERYLYVVGRSADILALDDDGGHRSVCAHYIETAAFGGAPDRLRGGCIAAFTTSPAPSTSLVVVVAELLKGSGGRGSDHKDICEGIKRAVWEEDGVRVGWIVLVESGVVPKTTSGKLRRGAARDKLLAGKLPILFEARYDGAESSVPWAGGEEEMEKCPGMDTAYGSASRRLRLQSFL